MKAPGQLSSWRLLGVPSPTVGPEPWQEEGLQIQLWPLCCLVRWVQTSFPPQPGMGLRQSEPSRQWQTQLYRGELRLFQRMNKGCLKGGGHEPGETGIGSFRATSETQHVNALTPCLSSALVRPATQTPGSNQQAHPCLLGQGERIWNQKGWQLPPQKSGGPRATGSHHRRLKTRLTVRMMPRRRTKGSQVFTKAPTLTYFP